jgi:hypothetical protein
MANSRTIPVRMPEDLYQEIIASKPAELKASTYLLMLIRKGLLADSSHPPTRSDPRVQNVDRTSDSTLITSLQSRIASLEEQLEAVQNIVDEAQAIRTSALAALSNVDTTVEAAVQKAVDTCNQFVDRRIQETIEQQMSTVLGETFA